MRKRDILQAMQTVAARDNEESQFAFEKANQQNQLDALRQHLQSLRDIQEHWSLSGDQAMVEKTQRDIDAVALQIAELDVAPVTNGAY